MERPLRGVKWFVCDVDEVDIVEALPVCFPDVKVPDSVGRGAGYFDFQHVRGRLEVLKKQPERTHYQRADVALVEADASALRDMTQVEQKRLAITRAVECDGISRGSGEPLGVFTAQLGPGSQLVRCERTGEFRATFDELNAPVSA